MKKSNLKDLIINKTDDKDAIYLNKIKLTCFYNILKKLEFIPETENLQIIYDFLGYKSEDKIRAIILEYIDKKDEGLKNFREALKKSPTEGLEDYCLDDLLREHKECNDLVYKKIMEMMKNKIDSYGEENESKINFKIQETITTFKLNEVESEVFVFTYLYRSQEDFSDFIDNLLESPSFRRSENLIKNLIGISFKRPYYQIKEAFTENSKLIKYAILNPESQYELSHEILRYLNGDTNEPLKDNYFRIYHDIPLNIESFTFPNEDIEIILNLLKNGKNSSGIKILFYGKPGTGKTEFARSLGYNLNLKIFEVKKDFEFDTANTHMSLYRGVIACENYADKNDSLVIVDESEILLESMNSKNYKNIINNLLSDARTNQIWITNSIYEIDESTKRRFNYSLKFKDFDTTQRKIVWSNIIRKYNYQSDFNDEDIESLAEKYTINPGVIEKSLENCKILCLEDKKMVNDTIDKTIKAHNLLSRGVNVDNSEINMPMNDNYSLEGLNIKSSNNNYLSIIDKYNENYKSNNKTVRNLNILLWGPPGTGKTELAKYISRRLKRNILVKKTSDILNEYIGGTERNINEIFKEAANSKSILFLDEIDGILSNRVNAYRSWEVTQVNELLVNMENFEGILICATNFLSNLDIASLRRFNIKLEFDYLNGEGNLAFYNKFFKNIVETELQEKEIAAISSLKLLTPGDFKNIYQQTILYENEGLTHSYLISSLESEVRIKSINTGKKIGFIA